MSGAHFPPRRDSSDVRRAPVLVALRASVLCTDRSAYLGKAKYAYQASICDTWRMDGWKLGYAVASPLSWRERMWVSPLLFPWQTSESCSILIGKSAACRDKARFRETKVRTCVVAHDQRVVFTPNPVSNAQLVPRLGMPRKAQED